ncbi:MAG: hypothetical protein GX878_08930 [Firmicutes bacterium]|nr:hypothetical protein [Bacillota bacterium]
MGQKKLSLGKLFLELIIRPGSAFQSMKVGAAVWMVIIMAIIAITFSSIAGVVKHNRDFSPEAIMEQPEMKRAIEEGAVDQDMLEETFCSPVFSFAMIIPAVIGALFTFTAGWMVKSSILLGAVSLAGGKMGWKESAAAVGASWIPFFFHHLLKGTAALLGWQVAAFTGTGALLVSHLNIFVLWNLALLTVAFTAIAGIPRIKAFACAAGYQAVVILINLGLIKLGGAFTGGML